MDSGGTIWSWTGGAGGYVVGLGGGGLLNPLLLLMGRTPMGCIIVRRILATKHVILNSTHIFLYLSPAGTIQIVVNLQKGVAV